MGVDFDSTSEGVIEARPGVPSGSGVCNWMVTSDKSYEGGKIGSSSLVSSCLMNSRLRLGDTSVSKVFMRRLPYGLMDYGKEGRLRMLRPLVCRSLQSGAVDRLILIFQGRLVSPLLYYLTSYGSRPMLPLLWWVSSTWIKSLLSYDA